jgi:hypothetical protein
LEPWSDAWDRLPVDIQAEIIAFDQVASHDEAKEKHDLLTQLVKALTPKKK